MSSVSESEHDQHSSFIKTPQQLIVVVLAAFVVPIVGIILLVQRVISTPSADPNALTPESVAAWMPRLQPNQSGGSLKEPPAPAQKPAAKK